MSQWKMSWLCSQHTRVQTQMVTYNKFFFFFFFKFLFLTPCGRIVFLISKIGILSYGVVLWIRRTIRKYMDVIIFCKSLGD